MNRYSALQKTHGESTHSAIHNSKVLIVGAGGIGCEILKNVAMMGFKYIELIDLDTIDVSNLNRQFLFRTQHVGQPKALVAAEAAKRFNPNIQIIPHHANIKDNTFGISYFKTFHVVLNALDNIDARRHVNRLCLAAGVPLIDSGTTGYLGQVMPIKKDVYACYECKTKPTPKVYPICTIRSTPDKPVHCIVWAKELFKLMMGNMTESMLYEDSNSTEEAVSEPAVYMNHIFGWELTNGSIAAFMNRMKPLLVALFKSDIERRIDMGTYKTAATIPVPIALHIFDEAIAITEKMLSSSSSSSIPRQAGWDNAVWTTPLCLQELMLTMYESSLMTSSDGSLIGKLSFDKDDDVAMRFVCAASNIRSAIFHIPSMSYHDAKGIAGNIIAAISTTNAIVAGIQVLQAVKVLTNPNIATLPHVYCIREPTRKGQYLLPLEADTPSTDCFECRMNQLQLEVDTSAYKFGDVIVNIIKSRLGFIKPCVAIGSSIIYEEDSEEDDMEFFHMNMKKVLKDCPGGGIVHDTLLTITDDSMDLSVKIGIKHVASDVLAQRDEIIATNMYNLTRVGMGSATATVTSSSVTDNQQQGDNAMGDDIMIVDEDVMFVQSDKPSTSHDRPEDSHDNGENEAKRIRLG